MDAPAGVVALHARKAEALPHDALPGKGRIAVDQDRQHLLVLAGPDVLAERLLRAGLAQHHRVHRFQMARVGLQAHVHLDPVELAVGAGAQVILHVARTADILGVRAATGKFVEDHPVGLGQHVRQHVEAAAVRQAVDDLAHAQLAAILDDSFQRRDHGFAAIQPEPLGADILLAEELLVLLAAHHGGQNGLLAVGGEVDVLVAALDAVLQELALLHVRDVHVFKADFAAVVLLQHAHDLARGGPLQPQRAAQKDLLVEVGPGETMIFGRNVRRQLLPGEAERIEVRSQMPAHAVGAHQQHRADRGARRRFQRGFVHRCTGSLRRLGDFLLQRHRIERAGEVVARCGIGYRPAAGRP